MRAIPEIIDVELRRRFARIKPALRFAEGEEGPFPHRRGFLYYLSDVHPRRTPLTWGCATRCSRRKVGEGGLD